MPMFRPTVSKEPPRTGISREDIVHGACRICGRRHILMRSTRTCIREERTRLGYYILVPDPYCLRVSKKKAAKAAPRATTKAGKLLGRLTKEKKARV